MSSPKHHDLRRIAERLALKGRSGQAIELLLGESIHQADMLNVLGHVAHMQAKSGDQPHATFELIRTTIRTTVPDEFKNIALYDLAESQLYTGHFFVSNAKDTIRLISDPLIRDQALSNVASYEASALNRYPNALETASKIQNPNWKRRALAAIALWMMSEGNTLQDYSSYTKEFTAEELALIFDAAAKADDKQLLRALDAILPEEVIEALTKRFPPEVIRGLMVMSPGK